MTGLVPRFWAQRYVDQLSLFPEIEGNEKKILEIGRKYSIVTPNTSFIVLETLDQYLKYEIEPPESLLFIREQWLSLMTEKQFQETGKKRRKNKRSIRPLEKTSFLVESRCFI